MKSQKHSQSEGKLQVGGAKLKEPPVEFFHHLALETHPGNSSKDTHCAQQVSPVGLHGMRIVKNFNLVFFIFRQCFALLPTGSWKRDT